jgi:hypothetical protein
MGSRISNSSSPPASKLYANVSSAVSSGDACRTIVLSGSITFTSTKDSESGSSTVPLTVIVSPFLKLSPFSVASNPPSDSACISPCCALVVVVKLEKLADSYFLTRLFAYFGIHVNISFASSASSLLSLNNVSAAIG